jgi:16S rRNA (guanine527-N7)-methyltransferase
MSADRDVRAHLTALAAAVGATVDAPSQAALGAFADAVGAWGARTDLTSARGPEALAEVLFLDALVLADPSLVPEGVRVVDVGAGAGAPALPLALLRPDLDVTLVEPRRRRVAFLRTAIGQLGLQARARVVEARVDPARPALAGVPYDLAVSRATFAPERWLPLGAALAARVAVLTAGPLGPMEGFEPTAHRAYRVPSTGAPRSITVCRACDRRVAPGPG